MPAQLRDYYLSNLGVVQYVPSDFCVPEVVVTDTQEVIAEPTVTEAVVEPAVVEVETTTAHSTSPAAKPVQKQVDVKPVVDTELRFRISYWQLPDLLVFSSLDYGENPPQDQHQLLSNILQAVGRLPGMLAEPEMVDWPVVPTAPADTEAAKTVFTSLLQGRAEQTGSRWILVMGQRARQFLLSGKELSGKTMAGNVLDGNLADNKQYGQASVNEYCQAVVTPGLDQMLADPQSKRTTWQLVRFLADAPASKPPE